MNRSEKDLSQLTKNLNILNTKKLLLSSQKKWVGFGMRYLGFGKNTSRIRIRHTDPQHFCTGTQMI
jgi:hypothetical protein